ncbi:MAG: thiamine-phosphate kinase [Candidatus Omnitrophica bacterium]|nr:thiamine-phosphate kinase [Candidatus Omnitrophota bacterium]MBU4473110.1 thiamine-phosphate kinase [Candidatus Omnitrophota bacterium]MCG2706869.1 thiamine-phosphate kinase [Candidatus Omnitrophota bacterium]
MRVDRIGEFGLIERLKKSIKTDSSVIKGSGDDCAVIKFNQDQYLLFTCDTIVEGVDFRRQDMPYLVGRKALAASISDIAACGGIPRYALLSLAIPKNISVHTIDKISQGIFNLAKRYNINIVGGDISRAKQLMIDISMLGAVEKKYLALRSGAKKGDIIFVTGKLGGSILRKHLEFTPRLKEARFLVKNFRVHSMIDISDSLTQDLGQILKASKVGAIIYEGLIPLSKDALSLADALYTGEDFELLFTLGHNEAKRLYAKRPKAFRPIGEIMDRRYNLILVDKKGKGKIIKPRGFQHF